MEQYIAGIFVQMRRFWWHQTTMTYELHFENESGRWVWIVWTLPGMSPMYRGLRVYMPSSDFCSCLPAEVLFISTAQDTFLDHRDWENCCSMSTCRSSTSHAITSKWAPYQGLILLGCRHDPHPIFSINGDCVAIVMSKGCSMWGMHIAKQTCGVLRIFIRYLAKDIWYCGQTIILD